ncbi:MAG: alpha/beta hydrolase [Bacteroidales bacterium]|nr:alpha/beta hydrolase [Bacteroidales bacterium]
MEYTKDILGDGYEVAYISQPSDYSGEVRCAAVRKQCAGAVRAVLYVHGYSDYFFQKEMGDAFVSAGYAFYAVELRKYGRSLLPGQKMFQVRDLREYYADIEAALKAIEADGIEDVALLGHSTGGLTSALFVAERHPRAVSVLMLNSPFLAWNLPAVLRKFIVPAVGAIGRKLPWLPVHQPADAGYAQSLHANYGGEWNYSRDWKPDVMPDPDSGWIGAIDSAQKELARCRIDIPVLLMHSARSAHRGDGPEAYYSADAILDVESISKAGRGLGPDVTEAVFEGGLHDLVLSRPSVRREVMDVMLRFLAEHPGEHQKG